MNFTPALGYTLGTVVIVACIFVLLNSQTELAMAAIVISIVLFSGTRHLMHFTDDWLNGLMTFALIGGSLIILSARIDMPFNPLRIKIPVSTLTNAGRLLIAAFFIASGYAHFKFATFVIAFIPGYIPFHSFFTYFCGICLIAGGVGINIRSTRALSAMLSGIMVTGWFLLLHIPRFVVDTSNASDRIGLCESLSFAGVFFVLTSISYMEKSPARVVV